MGAAADPHGEEVRVLLRRLDGAVAQLAVDGAADEESAGGEHGEGGERRADRGPRAHREAGEPPTHRAPSGTPRRAPSR